MSRAQKESLLHLIIHILIQWISLAIVALNAAALYLLKHQSRRPLELQQHAFVHSRMNLADYALLILGSVSCLGSTTYLLLYSYLYINMKRTVQSLRPPKWISATEVVTSVISIALWTVASSVILTHSQEPSAPCRFPNSLHPRNTNVMCKLFDTTLILAFAVVGGWLLVLFATLFNLIQSPTPPTTIFTIEAPPPRFSQGTFLSRNNYLYNRSSLSTIAASDYSGNLMKPVSSYTLRSNNINSRSKIIPEEMNEKSKKYIIHEETEEENGDSYEEQVIGLQLNDTRHSSHNNSYYQPHCVPLSSAISTESPSSLSSSTRSSSSIVRMPLNDTTQSLSTMGSFASLRNFKPIQLDLPIIKLGMLSHIGLSFLDNRLHENTNGDQKETPR